MDPITLVALIFAFVTVMVVLVLEGGSPTSVLLLAPLILVFGGTFACGAAGVSTKLWIASIKAGLKSLLQSPPKYDSLLETLVDCANVARRDGLLSLEATVTEIEEPLLRRGLELAIDGTDPTDLARILEAELYSETVNGNRHAKLFVDMGGYAPTIGIIGTILGLVTVLGNLSNPDELGGAIAAAFVAAMWGVLSANVFWLPMGAKMRLLNEMRATQGEVIIEGIMSIQAGANPRMVERRLRALLPADILRDLEKAA
jgi:chemotaxis protein MotA